MRLDARISQILLDSWDPIGIRGEPDAEDEYDSYALTILGMLFRGTTVLAIFEYLRQVETVRMLLPPTPDDKLTAIAEELLAIKIPRLTCSWCGEKGEPLGDAKSFRGTKVIKCTACHHEWEMLLPKVD